MPLPDLERSHRRPRSTSGGGLLGALSSLAIAAAGDRRRRRGAARPPPDYRHAGACDAGDCLGFGRHYDRDARVAYPGAGADQPIDVDIGLVGDDRGAGEFAENEMRKNFMPSERVAIMETIERKGRGARTDLGLLRDRGEVAKAAELAGFSSWDTARRAQAVAADRRRRVARRLDEIVRWQSSTTFSIAQF